MASPVIVFGIVCFIFWRMAPTTGVKFSSSDLQKRSFKSVITGQSVTLPCLSKNGFGAKLYWYKHTLSHKPRLISTYHMLDNNVTFYSEFKNNPRFRLDKKNDQSYLTITDMHPSDSAIYYCMSCYLYSLEISESTTVIVEGSSSNIPAVDQSISGTVHPGGSVNLNCVVQTGTCDGKHSVYWFKDSRESVPGIIYTSEDRNNQCERKTETQTNTCVYNLPIKNLTRSHAGTYYCAVASCGHILLGKGSKLDIEDKDVSVGVLYFLSGALTFTTILVVLLLTFLLYKRNPTLPTVSQANIPAPVIRNTESYQEDNLHYAALSVNMSKKSRRHKNNSTCEYVYSSVK